MRKRMHSRCQTCGKKAEYAPCSQRGAPPEDARCKALDGWLSVAHWKGMMEVGQYDFCSFTCLQKWVDENVPKVPESFLKAFDQDSA